MKIKAHVLFFTVPFTNYFIKYFYCICNSVKEIISRITENYLLDRSPLPFSTSP